MSLRWSGPVPSNRKVIESGDRIGLRPQADLTLLQTRICAYQRTHIFIIDEKRVVEPSLNLITDGYHPYGVPPPKGERLHIRRDEHVRLVAIVVVQPDVVLTGVCAHHVVLPFCKAKDDAA